MGRYDDDFFDYMVYEEVMENRAENKKRRSKKTPPRKRAAKTSGCSAVLFLMLLIVAAVLALSAMFSALGKETSSHYKLNPSYQNYTSASTSQTDYHN
jgi:cell division protein FtsL